MKAHIEFDELCVRLCGRITIFTTNAVSSEATDCEVDGIEMDIRWLDRIDF